jgi:glycosyltransferase involved in cell wall biosynthesis
MQASALLHARQTAARQAAIQLHFSLPPPEKRAGGLEAAINGLWEGLNRAGTIVDDAAPSDSSGNHLVHFHGAWQLAQARLARQLSRRGIPFVVSPHGMFEEWALHHKWWKKFPYFHLVEKRYLNEAIALLATGRLEAEHLRDLLPGRRVEALPLGLTGDALPDYDAARRALGWKNDERVLLFLSRLHIKKGLNLLLEALASMQIPQATRLVIVGDGEDNYVQSIRAKAQRLGKALPKIDWVGKVWGAARWPYFQGADLFCLPTFSENFGLAVLDACQVGTPVLTTTMTPWLDYLGDRKGFICEPTVEGVAHQLGRFFAESKHTARDRKALSDWAWSTFHWDKLAPRYLAFYRSLLQAT